MTRNFPEKNAAEAIESARGAIGMIYQHSAPEKDRQEAIAWALAAIAESNLAIATAITELTEEFNAPKE